MRHTGKTKVQLIDELAGMRRRIVDLEKSAEESRQMEQSVQEAREYAESIVATVREPLVVLDADLRVISANRAFYQTFEVTAEEAEGQFIYDLGNHQWDIPALRKLLEEILLKSSTFEDFEVEYDFPAIGRKAMLLNARRLCRNMGKGPLILLAIEDISRRREMEQLIITDRLASVGELAAGIAHELNNPLTGVIGFAQMALDEDIPDDIKKDMQVVYNEAQRAAQVVRNLLTFAQKHAPEKQLMSINNIIDKVLELRAYEQKVNNIRVKTRFAPDPPGVRADYFQLQQVFLNIIINAEYFMIEAHNGGNLTITTERAGDIIKASFADDGPGIAEENLGHLFDPFFTTKEVGKGTGLGLSICHGIVVEHGGRIYVESELGEGATFIVELPIGTDGREGG
jgi:PAS domain S-box-containing protein